MIGRIAVLAGLVWIHAVGATPAAAQTAATTVVTDDPEPTAATVAERLRPTAASAILIPGVPVEVGDAAAIEPLLPFQRRSAGVPLMTAGAVLFVAGAIVGGDAGTVLMIGGAGIAAYGVYLYFR